MMEPTVYKEKRREEKRREEKRREEKRREEKRREEKRKICCRGIERLINQQAGTELTNATDQYMPFSVIYN